MKRSKAWRERIAAALLCILAAYAQQGAAAQDSSAAAQTSPVAQSPDAAWAPLRFLAGTWEAKTSGGSAGAAGSGTYTFQMELRNHVLARHSTTAGCRGPAGFDCEHTDLMYIYPDQAGRSFQAIFFDNEGHTIEYRVQTPRPDTALFVSLPGRPGPQYRLTYELKSGVMEGKFQMRMPGAAQFQSYLEWSGGKAASK